MGAVEGRTGSSWGTMRLKSASAASISSQRGWGNEGLKWLERIVGVFTMRAGCESRKCSLDWHLEKGNRRSKKGEVYICAFPTSNHQASHQSFVFLGLSVGPWGPVPFLGPWVNRHTNATYFQTTVTSPNSCLYIHMTIWKSHYEFIAVLVSVDSVNSTILSIL